MWYSKYNLNFIIETYMFVYIFFNINNLTPINTEKLVNYSKKNVKYFRNIFVLSLI